MATPESDAGVRKMYQHMQEVEVGLIPSASPPDFVRSDWLPDKHGFPGWFGPNWHPTESDNKTFQGGPQGITGHSSEPET